MTARLSISLLGPFQVTLDGQTVTQFGSDTARALLAYLALHPGEPRRRDALAGLLWPEHSDTRARHNLRAALSRLRSAIDDREARSPLLEVACETIRFSDDAASLVDVLAMRRAGATTRTHAHAQLETCAACAGHLQAIADLYRGEFLAGFSLESAPFEEWMVVEREALHWQAPEALSALAAYHEGRGEYPAAIACARRQVELEPWWEGAHRQWMRALALSGHRAAALAQYEACRRTLAASARLVDRGRGAAALVPGERAGQSRDRGTACAAKVASTRVLVCAVAFLKRFGNASVVSFSQ